MELSQAPPTQTLVIVPGQMVPAPRPMYQFIARIQKQRSLSQRTVRDPNPFCVGFSIIKATSWPWPRRKNRKVHRGHEGGWDWPLDWIQHQGPRLEKDSHLESSGKLALESGPFLIEANIEGTSVCHCTHLTNIAVLGYALRVQWWTKHTCPCLCGTYSRMWKTDTQQAGEQVDSYQRCIEQYHESSSEQRGWEGAQTGRNTMCEGPEGAGKVGFSGNRMKKANVSKIRERKSENWEYCLTHWHILSV